MSALIDLLTGAAVGVPMAAGGFVAGRSMRSRRNGIQPLTQGPGAGDTHPRAVSGETERVLGALSSGWLLVDRSDRITAHSADAEVLGLVRDTDLRHDAVREIVRRARREGRVVEAEPELPRGPLQGSNLDLFLRVAPLNDDVVVVLVEDRTQARRIEETRRDFVVNVSHELKTPVGGLRLLAEAVEDAADDPEAVARFAARMKTETVRLANLVQEIVDLSRLQGVDTVATAKQVDLGECAERAVDETRLLAEERRISLSLAVDEGPHTVLGDENLLTTACRNLVNNAVNYSAEETRIVVAVSAEDDAVVVQVTDQGVGLTAAEIERIFERFYRVDPARSRRTGGTGLGLAIVKHVCANHGGQIRVWSEPGVGSTFEMQIPASSAVRHGSDGDGSELFRDVVGAASGGTAEMKDRL